MKFKSAARSPILGIWTVSLGLYDIAMDVQSWLPDRDTRPACRAIEERCIQAVTMMLLVLIFLPVSSVFGTTVRSKYHVARDTTSNTDD